LTINPVERDLDAPEGFCKREGSHENPSPDQKRTNASKYLEN
jgi:hypothetical protein